MNFVFGLVTTSSSFYSIFTSTIPTSEGSYTPIPVNKKKFTEIIQKNDILTCGIHSNPHLSPYCNYQIGFNAFLDMFEKSQYSLKKKLIDKFNSVFKLFKLKIYIDKIKIKIFQNFNLKKKISSYKTKKINAPYSNAKIIVSEAIRWLNKNFKSSFFLWIHFMDAHRPYYPPLKYINKVSNEKISESLKVYLNELFDTYKRTPDYSKIINEKHINALNALYDAEICYVDYYIGILITYLKKIKIYQETNFIITSDHGQALFDHNQLSHGISLYDELLKVPLIIKLQTSFNKQMRVEEQIELIDIAPTILNLFNLPKYEGFHGKSLLPLIIERTLKI